MDNQRNFILAAVLSLAVVFFWQMLVISPRIELNLVKCKLATTATAKTTATAAEMYQGFPSSPV